MHWAISSILLLGGVCATACQTRDVPQIEMSDLIGGWNCTFPNDGETQQLEFNPDGTYPAQREAKLQSVLLYTDEPVAFSQTGTWDLSDKALRIHVRDLEADYESDQMAKASQETQALMNELIATLASVDDVGSSITFDLDQLSLDGANTMHWGKPDVADRMICERREGKKP